MAALVTAGLAGSESSPGQSGVAVLLFPLPQESCPFLRRVGGWAVLHIQGCRTWIRRDQRIVVAETGIGAKRTRAALESVSRHFQIHTIISAGFAGALDPNLRVGDVILADSIGRVSLTGQTNSLVSLPPTWPGEVLDGLNVQRGKLLSMDRIIGEPLEKRQLYEKYEARAVDMESATVATWCAGNGIGFGAVRAITDDASTAISPAIVHMLGEYRLSAGRVFGALSCHPIQLGRELWRLRRNSLLASEALSRALVDLKERRNWVHNKPFPSESLQEPRNASVDPERRVLR